MIKTVMITYNYNLQRLIIYAFTAHEIMFLVISASYIFCKLYMPMGRRGTIKK